MGRSIGTTKSISASGRLKPASAFKTFSHVKLRFQLTRPSLRKGDVSAVCLME
jgi:hypothetical protein